VTGRECADALLAEMDKLGVRGVRINVSPVKRLRRASQRPCGAHRAFEARCARWAGRSTFSIRLADEELLPVFARLRCSFTIRNMACSARGGPQQSGIRKLIDLLRHGEGRPG